jgi:hypothetical protein
MHLIPATHVIPAQAGIQHVNSVLFIVPISEILLVGRGSHSWVGKNKVAISDSHKTFLPVNTSYRVVVEASGALSHIALGDVKSMLMCASRESGYRLHAENRAKSPFPDELKAGGVVSAKTQISSGESTWLEY